MKWMMRIGAVLLALMSASGNRAVVAQSDAENAFRIGDYFQVERIVELGISSDGQLLAFATQKISLEQNKTVRRNYLQSLNPGSDPVALDALADARELAWTANSHELSFLSDRSGSAQLFSYNADTGETSQKTRTAEAVVSFRFASNGEDVAYVTQAHFDPATSLYQQFRTGEAGILVDTDTISAHDFVNPKWSREHFAISTLWVQRGAGAAVKVPIPGHVGRGLGAADNGNFSWSSDAGALSVTYVADNLPSSQLKVYRTSVGVFAVDSGRFEVLAQASEPVDGRPGTNFSGGEWLPGERKLLIRRVTETDAWVSWSYPDWAIVDPSKGLPTQPFAWRPMETYSYPYGLHGSHFFPRNPQQIWVEVTVEAAQSLFVISPGGRERSAIVEGLDGSCELFQFSADFKHAAFVNESLAHPPEIYVRSGRAPARQVTHLNADIAQRIRHTVREVSWRSTDGVTVKGWLLEPAGSGHKQPLPLLTFVHGGPGYAFPNAFAPLFFKIWPYPFEVMAAQGMAVFMPNYRGTKTFGRAFASPQRKDREPVDDVLTGVEHLIRGGVADPARLGISGESHGTWVGAMAMTRKKMFRASSLDEGVANEVVMYELMPGGLNRDVHDPISGGGQSLYDSPQRYIEGSPDLYFKDMPTASLFEAGAYGQAISMLGFPKAAKHFGIPTEFVIYPQTEHGMEMPRLQRESAQRNLDWFRFWLQDHEDPGPVKAGQYKRWRELRKLLATR